MLFFLAHYRKEDKIQARRNKAAEYLGTRRKAINIKTQENDKS
jgi:hypothetical protein